MTLDVRDRKSLRRSRPRDCSTPVCPTEPHPSPVGMLSRIISVAIVKTRPIGEQKSSGVVMGIANGCRLSQKMTGSRTTCSRRMERFHNLR